MTHGICEKCGKEAQIFSMSWRATQVWCCEDCVDFIESLFKGSKFKIQFKKTMDALYELVNLWDNDSVKDYPEYLPSFDEFVSDFSRLLEAKE